MSECALIRGVYTALILHCHTSTGSLAQSPCDVGSVSEGSSCDAIGNTSTESTGSGWRKGRGFRRRGGIQQQSERIEQISDTNVPPYGHVGTSAEEGTLG